MFGLSQRTRAIASRSRRIRGILDLTTPTPAAMNLSYDLVQTRQIHISNSIRRKSNAHVHQDVASPVNSKGEFIRNAASFRDFVSADGSTGLLAEGGRYHLYVSLACPWAHRALIVRKLKGLENAISYTVVDYLMLENGWRFNDQVSHGSKDPVFGAPYLRDVYLKASPGYDGRITVPILFDKMQKRIVNNESSEIIRMLNSEFNEFSATQEQRSLDIYPEDLRKEIDIVNDWIYQYINNGVYRTGFSHSQEAYDRAVADLFNYLDKAEERLGNSRYLVEGRLTEADIRLYTTLIRFDKVYHGHFKCNKRQIKDYSNLWGYLRDLYQITAFKDTTDFEHIMKHYMMSHRDINPLAIVSVGPDLDFDSHHCRSTMFAN